MNGDGRGISPPFIDQLLLPPKLVARMADDLHSLATAAGQIGDLAGDVRGRLDALENGLSRAVGLVESVDARLGAIESRLGVFDSISDDIDGLRQAFADTNRELTEFRETMAPLPPEVARLNETFGGSNDRLSELRETMSERLINVRDTFEGSNDRLTKMRDTMEEELTGVRETFEGSNRELAGVREGMEPMREDVAEMREVVEPLEGVSERVGRFADRLPGKGGSKD